MIEIELPTPCSTFIKLFQILVLQRFYHQQSQHRDKSERNRATIDSTNPFLSHIPKYQFESSSPSGATSESSHHDYLPPNISNTPPSYNSNIPTYQPQSNQNSHKNPFTYNNSNNRKISSSPQNVYNQHGGGNSGYGNQDVYSNNLYGRTTSKMDAKSNADRSLVNGKSDSGKEDQGKLHLNFLVSFCSSIVLFCK